MDDSQLYISHTTAGNEQLIQDVETTVTIETISPTPANQDNMVIQETASNDESQDLILTTPQPLEFTNDQRQKISNVLIFSLLTLMVMFCVGTPFTLMLTIPAYILADQVRK